MIVLCSCGNHQYRNGVWFTVTNTGCVALTTRPRCAVSDKLSLRELLIPIRSEPLYRIWS